MSADKLGDPRAGLWLLRREDGTIWGPFPAAFVRGWIEDGKLEGEEEVARPGASWRRLRSHVEFGELFPEQARKESSPASSAPARGGRRGLGLAAAAVLLLGGVAGAWFLGLIPGSPRGGEVPSAELAVEAAPTPAPTPAPGMAGRRLLMSLPPGDASLGDTMPPVTGGMSRTPHTPTARLEADRVALESWATAHPEDPVAVAALAETYALLAARSGEGAAQSGESADALLELIPELPGAAAADGFRASTLLHRGRKEPARVAATAQLEASADDVQARLTLGLLDAASPRAGSSSPHLDRLVELLPDWVDAHLIRAEAGAASGDLRAAIESLSGVAAEAEDPGPIRARLGGLHLQAGDVEASGLAYEAALAAGFDPPPVRVARAVLLYQVEDQAARAAELLEPLLADPAPIGVDRRELGVHRAAALRLAGDPEASLAQLDRLEGAEGWGPAAFHRGAALIAAGRPGDALVGLLTASGAEEDPRAKARLLFLWGRAFQLDRDHQGAIGAYSRALRVDPTMVPAALLAAEAALAMGSSSEAADNLLAHVGGDPLDYRRARAPGLYYDPLPSLLPAADGLKAAAGRPDSTARIVIAAAAAQYHVGRMDVAQRLLDGPLDQQVRSDALFLYAGLVAMERGAAEEAAGHFRQLIAMTPESGAHQVLYGEALSAQNEQDKAAEAYEAALGHGAGSAHGYVVYGELLGRRGDPGRARTLLEEALTFDPSVLESRRALFELKQ